MTPSDTLKEDKHHESTGSCQCATKQKLGCRVSLKVKGFGEPFEPTKYSSDTPLSGDTEEEEQEPVEEYVPELLSVLRVQDTKEAAGKLSEVFPSHTQKTAEEKLDLLKKYLCAGVPSEEEAAKKLTCTYPYAKYCRGTLWTYDFSFGFWCSSSDTALLRVTSEHGVAATYVDSSGQVQESESTYSSRKHLRSSLLDCVKQSTEGHGWMQKKEHSSGGKALFQSGYYDFKETKFYSEEEYDFSSSVVLFGCTHDDYLDPTKDTF